MTSYTTGAAEDETGALASAGGIGSSHEDSDASMTTILNAYDEIGVKTGVKHSESALSPQYFVASRTTLTAILAAEFGPTAYYVHLTLLGAVAFTQTSILSCICTVAFFFYATRPPVGK